MGNRSPEKIEKKITIGPGDYLDTFEAFRGPVLQCNDCIVTALVNVGVDGPVVGERDDCWIDKCILVAKNVVMLDSGQLHANSIVIGGTNVESDDGSEIEIRAGSIQLLLFSDSVIHFYNPFLGQSDAEEFIRSVDVSDTCWLQM